MHCRVNIHVQGKVVGKLVVVDVFTSVGVVMAAVVFGYYGAIYS